MRGFKIILCAFVLTVLCSISAYAKGSWVKDNVGWWYRRGDGGWPSSTWEWIDSNGDGYADCYYFNNNGYCVLNTYIDGYQLNNDGKWVVDGQVMRKYVGNIIDHINNPGRTVLTGTIEVLTRSQAEERDNLPAEYRSGGTNYIVLFHFDQPQKINIMSADEEHYFVEDANEVYLPDGNALIGYNGKRVALSINFKEAYSPTDAEVPIGLIRVYDAYLTQ